MPNRRTMIVLGCLVAMMTVATGILRLFEPGPVAPLTGITLQSIEHEHSPADRLFDTHGVRRDWRAIVVHDSGGLTGSARTLNHRHQQLGREGLGYHFVVNNGTQNQRDGAIEVGYRWQHQQRGDYLLAASPDAPWFHEHAIGVCVIGDADRRPLTDAQLHELVWLVQKLQHRYDIPASRVYLQLGDREPMFPRGWFRDQLLAHHGP